MTRSLLERGSDIRGGFDPADVGKALGPLLERYRMQAARAAARRRSRKQASAGAVALQRLFGQSRATRWSIMAIIFLLGLLIVRPMIMSLMSYHRTASLLEERRSEVRDLAFRHSRLVRQVDFYKTDVFLAQRAREYGLVKPGEQPFVVRELAADGRQQSPLE